MKVAKYFERFFTDPKIRFGYLSRLGLTNWMNDEKFLKKEYKLNLNKDLDFDNPKTFNEKLQWLKLHDRKDIYTTMVDKYEVKKYVVGLIGDGYIIPTLGIYNKFDDIDFDKLPNQFAIKCTHDSGGVVIVKDKSKMNIKETRKKINKFMKRKYYYIHREWPYKNVKPRIIVEEYLDDGGNELSDYKIFNFNGIPRLVLVCSERSKELKKTWFNEKFERLELSEGDHEIDVNIKKPTNFETMIALSKKISKNMPFVRVDFYSVKGKIYFGEITFYPNAGFEKFAPSEWNEKLGDWIDITSIKNEVRQK